MLIFVEAGGRIIAILRCAAVAFFMARQRSRRRMVFVHCGADSCVFHRGRCIAD